MAKEDVIIVGGGIAGLCSAYYLLKKGVSVTVIDKSDLLDNCSYGNAGMIVPSHFIPLAAPGIIAKGVRWMFDKKSPFYIKPTLNPSVLKWGYQFWKHATARHVSDSAPYIKALNELGKAEYLNLKNEKILEFELDTKGILMLYKNKKTEEEEVEMAARAQDLGLDCEVLDKEGVKSLEPYLRLDVIGAVHYRSDAHIDPVGFMHELIRTLKKMRCVFHLNQTIHKIETQGNRVEKIYTDSMQFVAGQFVFATGANLGTTMKLAGINLPMLGGKGYSFMTKKFDGRLQYPALLIDDRVSITPMDGQVRIGGTMELATGNDYINMNKVQGISEAVSSYYPEVKIETPAKEQVWHGFRPCSPDGLPYLGRSAKLQNAIVAGGGGMMGVSCGPAFGKIVSELIDESSLSMDIQKFDPDRFD